MNRGSHKETVVDLLLHQVATRSDRTAFHYWDGREWRGKSWLEVAIDVAQVGRGFQSAGIQRGDRVALLADNSYEWLLSDLALQAIGAVSVPLHTQLSGEQIGDQIAHSGSTFAIVSSPGLYSKLKPQLSRLKLSPQQLATIDFDLPGAWQLQQWLEEKQATVEDLRWLQTAAGQIGTADLLTILYTSGTTGDPKGVMLTQRNVVANAYSKCATLPLGPEDIRVCWLPLSHIFARVCDLVTGILAGCETVLSRGRDFVLDECRQFHPTYMNAVPYFYERCYRLLLQAGQLNNNEALGKLLGGRMRICNCGGAPLADHVFDYFREAGIGLVTGYGLTEAAPVVTSNRPGAWRRGSVGQVISGVEIKLAEDGEVLARGENIMPGYYRNPDATGRALRDGWLHTEDLGHLDQEGYLYLNGRKDDLIVLSTAKKVYPTDLENLLLASPAITQCCLFGDRRNFLVAMVAIEPNELKAVAAAANTSTTAANWQEETVQQEFGRLLAGRASHEQIGGVLILKEPFSTANGMLTAKQSMRRKEIHRHYSGELEKLYESLAARSKTEAG
ncbi:MAG: AMP-dependent synthetase/ligase [Planctomycetota bacterium]